MRKLLFLPLALLLALVPGLGRPAAAYESWCFDDPVIMVNGRLIDVQVQMPVDNLLTMRSTTLTVIIPRNAWGAVLVNDVSAFPMKTTISATGPAWNGAGPLPIVITANVSASTNYSIRIAATPVASVSSVGGLLDPSSSLLAGTRYATGTANTTLKLPMSLGR